MAIVGLDVAVLTRDRVGYAAGRLYNQDGAQVRLGEIASGQMGSAGFSKLIIRTKDGGLYQVDGTFRTATSREGERRSVDPRFVPAGEVFVVGAPSRALDTNQPIDEILMLTEKQYSKPPSGIFTGLLVEFELPTGHRREYENSTALGIPVELAIPGKPTHRGLGRMHTIPGAHVDLRRALAQQSQLFLTTRSGNVYMLQPGTNPATGQPTFVMANIGDIEQTKDSRGTALTADNLAAGIKLGDEMQYGAGTSNTTRITQVVELEARTASPDAVTDYGAFAQFQSSALNRSYAALAVATGGRNAI